MKIPSLKNLEIYKLLFETFSRKIRFRALVGKIKVWLSGLRRRIFCLGIVCVIKILIILKYYIFLFNDMKHTGCIYIRNFVTEVCLFQAYIGNQLKK